MMKCLNRTSETTLTATAIREVTSVVDFMRKMYDHAQRAEVAASDWFQGRRETREMLRAQGGTRVDADTRWTKSVRGKSLVGDNQWQMAQAQMYGIITIVEQNEAMISLMREMVKNLERIPGSRGGA